MPKGLDELVEEGFKEINQKTDEQIAEELKLAEEEAAKIAEDEVKRLEDEAASDAVKEAAKKEEEVKDEEEDFILNPDEEEENKENPDSGESQDKTDFDPMNDKAFFEFASNKLGKDIKSFDDFKTEPDYSEDSEQLKQLRKFEKETNRDLRDWFKADSFDVENMTNEQLVKSDMKLKFGKKLTDSQINKRFNNKFKLDKENYDADDIELAEIDLAVDAFSAKERLLKLKEGYKIPLSKPEEQAKVTEQARKQAKDDKDAYVRRMTKEVDSIEFFDIAVDGQNVKYKLSESDLSNIKDKNQNLETFFNSFKDQDGKIDTKKLSFAMHFSNTENVAKLIKAVKGRYITEGVDKNLRVQKNTKLPNIDSRRDDDSESKKQLTNKLVDVISKEMGLKPRKRIKL